MQGRYGKSEEPANKMQGWWEGGRGERGRLGIRCAPKL